MRLLWTGELVEYQGKHYQFDALEMNPAPSAYIPIWVGGISEAAMRRAARIADGWVTDLQSSAEILSCVQRIQQYRKEYGRENLPFSVMATPSDAYTIDGYKRLEDGGVSHILTQPWPFYYGDTQELAKKIDGIKRYADDYIAALNT